MDERDSFHRLALILSMAQALYRRYDLQVEEITGLTWPQGLVLWAVHGHQNKITVSGLAHYLHRASHTITATVDRLEELRLVARRRDQRDRRRVWVSLTASGVRRLADYDAATGQILGPAQLGKNAEWDREAGRVEEFLDGLLSAEAE